MVKLYVTFFGLGFIPFASGTIGSLVGVATWLVLREIIPPWTMIFVILLLFLFSWVLTEIYVQQKNRKHDPSEVIVDEIIGQWVSLIPLIYLDHIQYPQTNNHMYFLIFISFILFRFFDILKPWPISIVDQQSNSLSILFDDILAGIISSICITAYISWIYFN